MNRLVNNLKQRLIIALVLMTVIVSYPIATFWSDENVSGRAAPSPVTQALVNTASDDNGQNNDEPRKGAPTPTPIPINATPPTPEYGNSWGG